MHIIINVDCRRCEQKLLAGCSGVLGIICVTLNQVSLGLHTCSLCDCRYTIFINIAVQGSSNQAWHIAQGPLSVVFGFGLGSIAAFCCSATRLWNNKYKRVFALVFSGVSLFDSPEHHPRKSLL